MLDYIAHSFLFFSDSFIIIPLIIIGYIWFDKFTFYHAVCLILFSILINVSLKISFQIPLSPALGKKGYAFPSGHMQLVTVLYSWIAFKINRRWFRALIVGLLAGIGFSLTYFGYHTFYDVAAGVFFGLILVFLYSIFSFKWPRMFPWLILVIATLLLFYIYARSQLADHVWMAYYTLLGFVIAEKAVNPPITLKLRTHKIVATILCFLSILIIHSFFYYVITKRQPLCIYQLQWLLIGFILPWVNFWSAQLVSRFNNSI